METKIITGLLMLSLLFSGGIAFAEESLNTTLSESDQNQIKDFNTVPGAQLRMLQLERSIMKNILIGDVVINITEKNHPEVNTTEMNLILDDMESLLDEVRNVSFEEGATAIASQFVEFKKESIRLTQEFRNETIKYLNTTDRAEIRDAIRNITDSLKGIDEQIKGARCELNAKHVENMLLAMNASDSQILNRIRNCNATLSEVKSHVRNEFEKMNGNQKVGAVKNIRAMAVEAASIRNELRMEIGKNISEIMAKREAIAISNRLEQRSRINEKLSNWTERQARIANESGMQIRAEIMQNISNRLQERSEWLKNASENFGAGGRK